MEGAEFVCVLRWAAFFTVGVTRTKASTRRSEERSIHARGGQVDVPRDCHSGYVSRETSVAEPSVSSEVSRETFNEYAPFGQHLNRVKHWTFHHGPNVSRETSVLDEGRKTVLNGSGSTRCR
jgi:hypothetical protein